VTWFRVDDNLAFHPKVIAAGNAAMGLWVRAGSWSNRYLTDGLIADDQARTLGTKAEAAKLVNSGLWVPAPGGYQFHEWDERQPPAADVKRAQDAESDGGKFGNHRRWHTKRHLVDPDCKYCQEAQK
jgi:hypothetical protein